MIGPFLFILIFAVIMIVAVLLLKWIGAHKKLPKFRIVARGRSSYFNTKLGKYFYHDIIQLQERRWWGYTVIYRTDKFENAVDLKNKLEKQNV